MTASVLLGWLILSSPFLAVCWWGARVIGWHAVIAIVLRQVGLMGMLYAGICLANGYWTL